jgi:outer membrane protein assembly factor BamB
VVPPLAADGRRVLVATRDGSVRALDATTGVVLWKAEGLPGRLSAAEGTVLVRGDDGTLWSLHPRSGAVRWKVETGIPGTLPAVLEGDRALVAGRGIAAVEIATGRLLWGDTSGAETTAPPVAAGIRVLSGEADGTLRCRDRATGMPLWTLRTGRALRAPPLVDAARRRVYLGATDKRVLSASLTSGKPGWSWRVGADVAHPGLLLGDRVVFAAFDAVLYALGRGGSLSWRAPLPSRPLSGPLPLDGHVLVACHEDEILLFTQATGTKVGTVRTAAEIWTPPLVLGDLFFVGLRDRSVIAYAAPARTPPPPAPDPGPAPTAPPDP